MKCLRCEQEIEQDAPAGAVICGICVDELRQEEDGIRDQQEAEARDMMEEMDREAYEEEERERHIDNGNSWGYC